MGHLITSEFMAYGAMKPAGEMVHEVAPLLGEKKPAVQLAHTRLVVTDWLVNCPAGQPEQPVRSGRGKSPGRHFTQEVLPGARVTLGKVQGRQALSFAAPERLLKVPSGHESQAALPM